MPIERKSERELLLMAEAGRIVAGTLATISERLQPGITTGELDEIAEKFIRANGGVPTFQNYRGYPASICASPNDYVVHAIPNGYTVESGDVLSIDVGVTLHGFVADAAYTFLVGGVSPEDHRLIEVCRNALFHGLAQVRPGNRLSDISHAIQRTAEAAGFSVVRELVGHGIGRAMHEDPQIPNYGAPGRGILLQPGMTFAIEPMINAGGPEIVSHTDEWAISTEDGSKSAHFEHTVAVTQDEPLILTAADAPVPLSELVATPEAAIFGLSVSQLA